MEPGDEIDGNASDQRRNPTVPGTGIPGRIAGRGKAAAKPTADSEPVPEGPARWGVVLGTFSDEGHEQMAGVARDRFAGMYPELKDAYVRSTPKGSVLLVGQFEGPTDPLARPLLEKIKALSNDGQTQPFSRAYLSRVQTSSSVAASPYDLSRALAKFPGVRPLFTVQVAMWSDFESKTLTMDDIAKRAEGYCKALRMKGSEAYVHHDEDKRTSIVTVGVFDSSNYDHRSTLFSSAVEKIFKQFPAMLVNGEELMMPPLKGSPPNTPLQRQQSMFIEIPQ